jgi:hypothetical protein
MASSSVMARLATTTSGCSREAAMREGYPEGWPAWLLLRDPWQNAMDITAATLADGLTTQTGYR